MFKSKKLEVFAAIVVAFSLILFYQLSSAQNMQDSASLNIPVLVLDEDPGLTLPKRFRTSKTEFKKTDDKLPTREGLDNLQIAGSAQFSQTTLENALKKIDGPVWIIDLRKESHGFVNGLPISWFSIGNQSNIHESNDNIQRQEQMLFRDVKRQGAILVTQILQKKEGVITKSKPMDIKVDKAQTESSLVGALNLGYLRIGVLDHHKPSDEAVDQFLEFVKTLPPEAWLYFHCRGGSGRTTTFMTMYDMIKNGKKVSFEDIMKRQVLIGGQDLLKIGEDEEDAWKREDLIDRKEFITKFYKYATAFRGYGRQTWSEWSSKN